MTIFGEFNPILDKFFNKATVTKTDYDNLKTAAADINDTDPEIAKAKKAKVKRLEIYARNIAKSILSAFKGLAELEQFKYKYFSNMSKEDIIKECNKLLDEKDGAYDPIKALGIAYTAYKLGNKESVEDFGFKNEKCVTTDDKSQKTIGNLLELKGQTSPAPRAAKSKKPAEEPKKQGAAPPAGGTQGSGQAPASNAGTAKDKKEPQIGVFASKKEAKEAKIKAKEFLRNLDHSLANINANEFEIIDATYARDQRFMGSKYEVKFEETAGIDETAFGKVVTAENQSLESFTGGSSTGKPWVDIKIIIQGHPEIKKDGNDKYLEYKVTRKDVYGRSFSDMQWVRGMGPMPCTRSTEFIEITSEKTCRKYLDGNKAGKVEIQVTKEETNQLN